MRQIIINADDLNYTPGINRSIMMLTRVGAISTTTAMMALEKAHIPDRGDIMRLRPRIGLHLQLTKGRPVAAADLVPGLIDTHGRFPAQDCVAGLDPGEVEIEWCHQLVRFCDVFGVPPCRIDSHHGVHEHPAFRPIAQALADEIGCALRRPGEAPGSVHHWTGQSLDAVELADAIRAEDRITPEGESIEVMVHPGLDTDQLVGLDRWDHRRQVEHQALLDLRRRWDDLLPGFALA